MNTAFSSRDDATSTNFLHVLTFLASLCIDFVSVYPFNVLSVRKLNRRLYRTSHSRECRRQASVEGLFHRLTAPSTRDGTRHDTTRNVDFQSRSRFCYNYRCKLPTMSVLLTSTTLHIQFCVICQLLLPSVWTRGQVCICALLTQSTETLM